MLNKESLMSALIYWYVFCISVCYTLDDTLLHKVALYQILLGTIQGLAFLLLFTWYSNLNDSVQKWMRMNLWFTESKLEDYTFMYDLVIELFYQEVCFLHKELIKGWYINSQYMPQYSSEKNHTIKFVEYLAFRW